MQWLCDRLADNVRQMNPNATIISVSAKTGEGLEQWFDWLINIIQQNLTKQLAKV